MCHSHDTVWYILFDPGETHETHTFLDLGRFSFVAVSGLFRRRPTAVSGPFRSPFRTAPPRRSGSAGAEAVISAVDRRETSGSATYLRRRRTATAERRGVGFWGGGERSDFWGGTEVTLQALKLEAVGISVLPEARTPGAPTNRMGSR